MKLTFALITLNEEANLERALRSCADLADEIVIVDSGSTDGTEAIARKFKARWEHQDWLGFVGQKNRALARATGDWVFCLDADEELSPALREEVWKVKRSGPSAEVAAYSVPRCVLYEGRWIRHGDWYPDRITRLVCRDKARYVGGRVHERLEVAGPVLPLQGDLHHYSFKDAADHLERCRHYARLWAEDAHAAGKSAPPWAPWTHAAFRWFRGYLLRGGFRDGPQGWRIAAFCAREVALKYLWLRDLNQQPPSSKP